MAVPIKVPDLGTTVDEIKVIAWLVKEGDTINRGEAIAEIETDKAVTELESVAEGVLLKQVVPAGALASKGEILAYVGRPDEEVPQVTDKTIAHETPEPQKVRGRTVSEQPRVAPIVRNLAQKLGVDLARVPGTGKAGMITREDVVRAANEEVAAAPPGAGEELLSRAQSAVARAVLESTQRIPHLRLTAHIDMTAAQEIRGKAKANGAKISYDAVFLKAMAKAIETVPVVAARLVGRRIIRPAGVHIAVAVGIGNDLSLPVIREGDRKDLQSLQQDIDEAVSQVRGGTLKQAQMTGGCITLSNLGMYPIESFDAIIFPEHSAILAVGSVMEKPVVVDGRVEVRPMATVRLVVDHRLINGRTAAEFLTGIKQIIESGEFAQLR